ncbi:energy transducer TonB [Stenotrophomonas sp. PFBMAA-4]|uniref:energy transducer TonB n=1 Tax=Stenotrophomonas sp. PFBMAA-4 TaxID=3043301 RepID=UPI0024B481FA|nr:energy transducer TonB [Stenotrophomonas sp. PFBMAA-4]MDI9272904.1 energy transducer TonB [Stenotrophomonas sp. PFBMAA-4]
MKTVGTFVIAVAVVALLSAGCSTLTPKETVATAGCSMLPEDVRYIDARVRVVGLTQDGAGCHFHAVAKNAAAARTQTRLLGRLAKLRCREVVVDDSSERVAAQDTNAAGVAMRITLRTKSGRPCKPSKATTGDPPAVDPYQGGLYSTYSLPPRYPKEAFREGRQGEVLVIFLIDGKHQTIGAMLDRSSGYDDMDEAAVEAAEDWKFDAVGDVPEISLLRVPMNFEL